MPLISAGDLRLNALQMGQGKPVVLIHGLLLGSLAEWFFTAAPALAPHHRVVLYDLRGHGRSDRPRTGYDLATLGDDLDALLAALGVDGPADLVGHSYGALVALGHALRHRDKVRRLVVIDAPLPPGRAEVFDDALAADPTSLLEHLPPVLREGVFAGGRRARRLVEHLGFLAGQTTLLSDVAREPDLDDAALATLRIPVLCVYGEASRCRPAAERLVHVLPDARLRIVPGGHFVPVEAPAELIAHLAEFLDG